MTNEQINAAVTQATGLWDYPYSNETKRMCDFCSDLNAMHEAEKTLGNQFTTLEEAYWRSLNLVKPHPIYATARQRAEAFLRTLGKWSATDKDSLTVGATTEESSAVQKEVQK